MVPTKVTLLAPLVLAILLFSGCNPTQAPDDAKFVWPDRESAASQIAAVNDSLDLNFPENRRLGDARFARVYDAGFDYLLGKSLGDFPELSLNAVHLTPKQCLVIQKEFGGVDLANIQNPSVKHYFILTNLWGMYEAWDDLDVLLIKTEDNIIASWHLSATCEY